MEPKVIFQDDTILVLDKPSGWITNLSNTTGDQPVVEDWISKNFKFEIFNFTLLRHGVVHRLDKETSGILLVAKTEHAFYELQRQFKERIVKKKYTALVHGKVAPKVGEIAATVGRLPWRRDRFGVLPGGRNSVTKYKVISYHTLSIEDPERSRRTTTNPHLQDYSLVEFYPQTGRTHQIRIHAKYIGHPLVSDDFYAGRKTARNDRKWCPRLFLHASGISFLHPKNGKKAEFLSTLLQDIKTPLDLLENKS